MDGYEKRRNEKKRAILAAALELFVQYGFDKVTLVEIAEKAHVSKVSIYNFFQSKDNLRRVIISDLLNEVIAKIEVVLCSDKSTIDKINDFFNAKFEHAGDISTDFLSNAFESDPYIKGLFEEYTSKNNNVLLRLIEEGKRNGCFDSTISNEAIEIYINMHQSYLVSNKDVFFRIVNNPVLAKEMTTLFWNGLMQQPPHVHCLFTSPAHTTL